MSLSPETVGIAVAILSGIISMISGVALNTLQPAILQFLSSRYPRLFGNYLEKKDRERISYSQKLDSLTTNLMKASKEVDTVLAELAQVAKEREKTVQELETGLTDLQNREKELKERIEQLQNVPLPVAEHFAKLTASGEIRSARRDYMLFGAGVVVSTVIAIILKLLGLG